MNQKQEVELIINHIKKEISFIFDVLLIAFCLYAAITWTWFIGGFGWFLLLFLSPRAWRKSC